MTASPHVAFNLNGEIQTGTQLAVSLNNRGLHYGDGMFETLRVGRGKIYFWEDHYFRLMASMRLVRMEIPMHFSPEYLEGEIQKTLEANDLKSGHARIKILVTRQPGGYYTPTKADVDCLITAEPLDEATYTLNDKGYQVDLYKDFFKLSGLFSNLKTSSAQLYTVASVFRQENDLDECLLLNEQKAVIEGISGNVFMVNKAGELVTPPLSDGCLKGVMRKQIIELAQEQGYTVKEESFNPFALQKAQELFFTNVIRGLRWTGQYRKKSYQNTVAQDLTKKLNARILLG
jgi:branched-chain amino acid aminotransferase